MSEYWVSKKKYFCKYCEIFIADDAPSRQQHENGLRHKGNQERFIRGLYKTGEKRKKDQEEEQREMQRVERAARAAFAQDVGAGLVKPGSAPVASSSTSAASRPPTKPSNPYADYSTAASLGYTDPDAERLKAESERRRLQGVAGEWELISQPQGQPSQPQASTSGVVDGEATLKREAEAPPPEDERSWKLRKKTVGPGLGDIYDPGVIPIKLKAKKEEPAEVDTSSTVATIESASESKVTAVPKWTKTQWKRAGEPVNDVEEKPAVEGEEEKLEVNMDLGQDDTAKPGPKVEDGEPAGVTDSLKKEEDTPIKPEENATTSPAAGGSGSMFRKRKAPSGVGNRGKR